MTHQYKPGDRVRHKIDGQLGRVQEVRKDGTVVVLWEGESDPWTLLYSPRRIDEYIEPIPAEPIPGDQPLTDAQLAQVVDAVLAKLAERQLAAPEGDPSRIQVGDTVQWWGCDGEATVVAVHGGKACLLDGRGLGIVDIHQLAKVTAHG